MLQEPRKPAQDEKGFTLIELLVVILIIGILAAIALPAFLNQRAKAQDTEAKMAARTAQTAEETYYTDNQKYTLSTTDLTDIEPALKQGVAGAATTPAGLVVTAPSGDQTYQIDVYQSKTGSHFLITKDDTAKVTRTCTALSTKGCPASGSW